MSAKLGTCESIFSSLIKKQQLITKVFSNYLSGCNEGRYWASLLFFFCFFFFFFFFVNYSKGRWRGGGKNPVIRGRRERFGRGGAISVSANRGSPLAFLSPTLIKTAHSLANYYSDGPATLQVPPTPAFVAGGGVYPSHKSCAPIIFSEGQSVKMHPIITMNASLPFPPSVFEV